MDSIADKIESVKADIDRACQKAGRERKEVELIAVSKTKPLELIQEAFAAGQFHFGENKVQELIVKQPAMPDEARWHLIGHLQKNKIRKALLHCDLLHTVDSVELANQVDRIAGELDVHVKALLQVNISNDEAKHGFDPKHCLAVVSELAALDDIEITGLMTIPAFDPDPEATRVHFANLRELRDQLESEVGPTLPQLSMGMSHDFHVAVEEGATLVRVGSSIFGSRG